MPLKPCLDCGRLSDQSRCPPCRGLRNRQRDQQRGTTTQRGYGAEHQQLRADIQQMMDKGHTFTCWRCSEPIQSGDEWDLGHDQGQHRGPEHARQCNRAEGGRSAHG